MQLARQACRGAAARRGSIMIAALLVVLVLVGVAATAFSITYSLHHEVGSQGQELRALYMAESGISEALVQIATAVEANQKVPDTVGTEADPGKLSAGRCWAQVADNGDGTYTVTSSGRAGVSQRTVEVVVADNSLDVFDHAIFAGNSSDDPDYELRLSGVGKEGDEVEGDIYSGGDVEIDDDATVDGDIYATGAISGAGGDEGIRREIPDIPGMAYEVNNDFDVAAEFAANGVYQADTLGGSAWELPQDNPAHIFRLNPSDRLTEINGTAKDDYFLEDPHESVTGFSNGSDPGHTVTLSGIPSEPGSTGTEKLYFIDGNLWLHNTTVLAFRLKHEGPEGARVTFVVKGNIYFCDDLVLVNNQKDGVAFIAMKDPKEQDSGNVYLGDPRFGTLSEMHAFLYAENDFYDHNLSASGSSQVEIYGNMTAGNHVSIERDYVTTSGSIVHSKLSVFFDERLSSGELELPGLPRTGGSLGGLEVVCWREVTSE